MILHRDYHLEFSVQQIEESVSSISPITPMSHCKDQTKVFFFELNLFRFEIVTSFRKSGRHGKLSDRQPIIQGHMMKLTQFNHPVHCAICHGFIWYLLLFFFL